MTPRRIYATPSEDFDWEGVEEGHAENNPRPPLRESPLELMARLHSLLRHQVLVSRTGRLRNPRTIATRLIVFLVLLNRCEVRTMSEVARQLGISEVALSKVGHEIGRQFGLRIGQPGGAAVVDSMSGRNGTAPHRRG